MREGGREREVRQRERKRGGGRTRKERQGDRKWGRGERQKERGDKSEKDRGGEDSVSACPYIIPLLQCADG